MCVIGSLVSSLMATGCLRDGIWSNRLRNISNCAPDPLDGDVQDRLVIIHGFVCVAADVLAC